MRRAKLRDRGEADAGETCTDRIRFCSALLPKWSRRSKSLDALIPALYLGGISSGDVQMALAALLGKDAPNISPAVVARLKAAWEDGFARWQKRDLSALRYVYLWADGVYLQARIGEQAECMLVIIGATPEGEKELVGFQVRYANAAPPGHIVAEKVLRRGHHWERTGPGADGTASRNRGERNRSSHPAIRPA